MMRNLTIPPLGADLEKVLIDAASINRRVCELAQKINEEYKDAKEPLIIVGVLKGSFIFLADLSSHLTIPHVTDFIAISSYGQGGDRQGNVRLLMDVREDIFNRDVLIIEDIIDSGNTLKYLQKTFKSRGANSVKIATFLDKPDRHTASDLELDYIGFVIPDVWVVGYGLDYKEKYRTLPYIAVMYPQL